MCLCMYCMSISGKFEKKISVSKILPVIFIVIQDSEGKVISHSHPYVVHIQLFSEDLFSEVSSRDNGFLRFDP